MDNKTTTEYMQDIHAAIRLMVEAEIHIDDATSAFKKQYALAALQVSKGNNCKASKMVGVHRNTLSRILPKSERPKNMNRYRREIA